MKNLQTTLLYVLDGNKILLGKKLRGFGEGLFNGIGGKVEENETVEQAMVRETIEEIGIEPINYEKVADITFDEVVKGERTNVFMSVFIAKSYRGELAASDEMEPVWFNKNNLPYQNMFPDDEHWLPKVLAGKKIKANFVYDKDFNIVGFTVEEK